MVRKLSYKQISVQQCTHVHFNNENSKMCRITCGVSQGSVLGPKLFTLFINEICKVSDLLSFVLFADDTTLYCSGNNLQELLTKVLRTLNRIIIKINDF